MVKPKELMEEYKARRSCPIIQNKLFDHMTNHAARSHWKFKSRPMEPSSWLDVCITGEQKALLAPTGTDITRGAILQETMGEGAKKKLAKRRINFWDGNISSYSRVLNSKEQLMAMREVNELTAVLGEIRNDNEEDRSKRAAAKASKAEEKGRRKLAAVKVESTRKAELMPQQLVELAETAIVNEATLSM